MDRTPTIEAMLLGLGGACIASGRLTAGCDALELIDPELLSEADLDRYLAIVGEGRQRAEAQGAPLAKVLPFRAEVAP